MILSSCLLSFLRCGSIVVEYDLLFDTDDPPTSEQLSQIFMAALDNQGFIPGTDFQLDTDSITFNGNISYHLCKIIQ